MTLTEEFNSPTGAWTDYDNYQAADRQITDAQAHVDIRSFRTVSWVTGAGASIPIDSTFRLAWNVTGGIGTIAQAQSSTPTQIVDLLTGFANTDIISMSLASFVTASYDLTGSFLDFTSGATGDFTSGPIASVALSTSSPAMTTGNSQFRAPRSAFVQNGIDLSKITGVRVRLKLAVANPGTINISAIRLLPPAWTFTSVDIDTRTGVLRRTPAPSGDATVQGSTWPIMWRAADVPGEDDPRPIDAELGVLFATGTIANTNSFTLYFREVTEDFLTQLDLNGLTQAALNGHDQPDIGQAMYNSRLQTDLEHFTQDQLANQSQFSLERTPDSFSASWIQFVCQWGVGSGTVSITDTEGNGYTFPISGGLTSSKNYVFYATLEENSVRATIFEVNSGAVGIKVFDSTITTDDTAYQRRKGRFGWHANLLDPSASIDSIRERRTTYAEYRSLPYNSVTPVVGAELFVSTSPPTELFQYLALPTGSNAASTLVHDNQRTLSGDSWKFDTRGSGTNQGVQTNDFLINNFPETVIKFDLYFPSPLSQTATATLTAALVETTTGRTINLVLPPIVADQWQHIQIDLPFDQTELTGRYVVKILQPIAQAHTWWIDNFTVYTRTVSWEGRAVSDDPWNSNDSRWTPFKDNLNSDNGGILFPQRGPQLQIRAKALAHSAHIDRVQFKPRYAELGRFTYDTSDRPIVLGTPSFTTVAFGTHGKTFTGACTFSLAGTYAANFEWGFGDGGYGIGRVVRYDYGVAGVFPITLTVTDNYGNQSVFVGSVSV